MVKRHIQRTRDLRERSMNDKHDLTEEEKSAEEDADNFTPLDKEKKKRVETIIEQAKSEKGSDESLSQTYKSKLKDKHHKKHPH